MNKLTGQKMIHATKWSTLTQISRKLISPLTKMILARILAPEMMGIVAALTIVINFVDLLTEGGFHRYLVQHEFTEEEDFDKVASVAFWTNLFLSLFFFTLIVLFRHTITVWVGVPGKERALVVASLSLPLTSFSSIQDAIFQRQFNYKTLFVIRFIGSFMPFVVTIPLALLGFGYWALLVGSLASGLYMALALSLKSAWNPSWFYDLAVLKKMIGFTGWSLAETISVWLSNNADFLILSGLLTSYYFGLYKTSLSMVNELLHVLSSALLPVTYAALSRLQHNRHEFDRIALQMQSHLTTLLIPMGVGIFIFRQLATSVFLGSRWAEASFAIGLWSLTTSLVLAYSIICDEVFRSLGKPKVSFFTHLASLLVLVACMTIFGKGSFESLIYARCAARLCIIPINALVMKRVSGISMLSFVRNTRPQIVATLIMMGVAVFLRERSESLLWQFGAIFICALLYFALLWVLPGGREKVRSVWLAVKPSS